MDPFGPYLDSFEPYLDPYGHNWTHVDPIWTHFKPLQPLFQVGGELGGDLHIRHDEAVAKIITPGQIYSISDWKDAM